MNSVERGRWKLVISRSTTRNRKPGVMKMSVSPENGCSVPVARAARFEQPQAGRAHRDDAAALGLRGVDPLGRRLVDLAPFGMHHVVVGIVGLDRQERPCPDMQRQPLDR